MPSWLPRRRVLGFQRFRSKHSYVIEHVRKMDLRSQYGIWHQGPSAKNTQLSPLLPSSPRARWSPPPRPAVPLLPRTAVWVTAACCPWVRNIHKRYTTIVQDYCPFCKHFRCSFEVHDTVVFMVEYIMDSSCLGCFTCCARKKRLLSRGISLR